MIFWLLLGIIFPPAMTAVWLPLSAWLHYRALRRRYGYQNFTADWFWAALIQALIWHLGHLQLAITVGALISAAIAGIAWWVRRKRRRALALLGAKSKARITAMVKTMRRTRQPSRVLRPHPVPS